VGKVILQTVICVSGKVLRMRMSCHDVGCQLLRGGVALMVSVSEGLATHVSLAEGFEARQDGT